MKANESHPNKIERREMFSFARSAADLIRETREYTRQSGQHASKRRTTYTPNQARVRQHNFLELLAARDASLPLVALELVREPEPHPREDNLTLDVGEFPAGTPLHLAAGALAIMATGLDKFVVAQFEDRELGAGPDDHYQEVATRFTVSRLPLEATAAYRRAAQAPPQENTLFDT